MLIEWDGLLTNVEEGVTLSYWGALQSVCSREVVCVIQMSSCDTSLSQNAETLRHVKVLLMLITFEIQGPATCVIVSLWGAHQAEHWMNSCWHSSGYHQYTGLSGPLHIYMRWLWSCEDWHHQYIRKDWLQAPSIQQESLTTGISDTRRYLATGTVRNIFSSCRLNLNESCLRLDAGDRFWVGIQWVDSGDVLNPVKSREKCGENMN